VTVSQQLQRQGASACVWKNGKVLVIQRPNGQWSLPGGHVEAGETAIDAAHRELREETRITANLTVQVGVFEISKPDHYAISCYCGLWRAGEAVAAGDALAAEWLSPSELYRFEFVPNVLEAIGRAQGLLKLSVKP
jgi:ADP-ribose pyrophosphatase YjhB (NUDIX family)